MTQYPPKNVEADATGAVIAHVIPGSPADDAGFEPGCIITSINGHRLRDVIDWRWHADADEITLEYIDLDGESGTIDLWREMGESWGIEFRDLVFDGVRQCRNACTFCFMRQLPRGMRPSLYVRDDDFRLSFLVGTFVTLTNMTPSDEERIREQHLSPLRVSLQAADPAVRRRLIGKHAQHGIEALDRLLAAGIQFHAQIVLVPGENDGDVLRDTLEWAYARPGILEVGIVPLGYTRHQQVFRNSFNDATASRSLLETVAPFQRRAQRERETAWVFAADEFYRNAWGGALLENLPETGFYGDFALFEDGVGIIRSTVDDWKTAKSNGAMTEAVGELRDAGFEAYMVAGLAQREFLDSLVDAAGIADVFHPLYIENDYFGGNVDVTGLLVGRDIAYAVKRLIANSGLVPESVSRESATRGEGGCESTSRGETAQQEGIQQAAPGSVTGDTAFANVFFLVPRVVFNDDGLTLDDMTLPDMEKAAGCKLHVICCSPSDYFEEIAALAQAAVSDANAAAIAAR